MDVIWSRAALHHLKEIAEYVADNFGTSTALKSVVKIQNKVNTLGNFPQSGVLDRKYSTSEYTVHHFAIAPNVVYYMLYSDAVVIGVIVHAKQSPKTVDKILNGFLQHYSR